MLTIKSSYSGKFIAQSDNKFLILTGVEFLKIVFAI